MAGLETKIAGLRLKTPLIVMSGVFGMDYSRLAPKLPGVGAVVIKSVTLHARKGNPEPRVIETPAGMLNSIGLQNPGIKKFLEEKLAEFRVLEVPIIASVAGSSIREYVECASLFAPREEISAIELNVSCPNVDKGGMEFGCDPKVLVRLVRETRKAIGNMTLIVKLSPNVTDIALPAQAAIDGGADVISLINTLRAMAIDLETKKPKLGNRIGGLSGRAIHPVAVYKVYRCYTACCHRQGIPIIGIGGVDSGYDALELIFAGATCVGIGTAMFRDERVCSKIENYLQDYMTKKNIKSISSLVGEAARQ